MEELEKLLAAFSADRVAHWWIGVKPACRDTEIVAAIASRIGFPTSKHDPEVLDRLFPLKFKQAASVLARAGTTSLAFDRDGPTARAVQRCTRALASLNQNPTFFTNGSWEDGGNLWWNPLTTATFDCGVIGWDKQNAFVFWVEEED